ncbi:MAG: RNA pseudouridine synthase [Bacteroidota bacterium]
MDQGKSAGNHKGSQGKGRKSRSVSTDAPLSLADGIAMVASRVLYMDNHLLIVNKPAGTLTQGDASGDKDLHSLAKAYLKDHFNKPGNVFLALVHRLDRPVSGVMVFPRTSKAASRVTQQFKQRTIEKRYIAMVEGRLTGSETLVNYVWKDHRKVRVVTADHPKGLRAELTYKSLAIEGNRSLVEVKLGTGRPHQIRVQLANIGHRIIGDFRYRAKTELDGRNLALHSYLLRLEHPTLGEKMGWTAPPPDSWGTAFKAHIKGLVKG